jgi:hypothetical protein
MASLISVMSGQCHYDDFRCPHCFGAMLTKNVHGAIPPLLRTFVFQGRLREGWAFSSCPLNERPLTYLLIII